MTGPASQPRHDRRWSEPGYCHRATWNLGIRSSGLLHPMHAGFVWPRRARSGYRSSDPAGVANDQFNQWLAVDPSDGSVNLSWNDTRNDPAHLSTDIFYALDRWRSQLHQERPGHDRSDQRNMLRRRSRQPVRWLRRHRRHGRLGPSHLDRPAGSRGIPRWGDLHSRHQIRI